MLILNMENKKHFNQIDFIRAVCCIGIIIYHFSCHTACNFKPLYETVNSNVGNIIVTVFFIVSGFVLYHNNKKIDSLKEFYYKRFKSIFPMFYICWFIFYLINVIKVRTPFYAGNPIKFLLTLIGQDGYFIQRIVNYYTVGEWFLGALIIVYALYPLLLKGFNNNDKLTLVLLIALTSIVIITKVPVISPGFPGICESCLKLYIGMMLYKYYELLKNKYVIIVSSMFTIAYAIIRIPYINQLLDIVNGVTLFVLLFNIGELVMKTPLQKPISGISNISYPIFLFQHLIIQYVLEFNNPISIGGSLVMLLVSVIITTICAELLSLLVRKLYKTKIYLKFESFILDR